MNKRTLAIAGATVLCAGGVAFAATASASTDGTSPAAPSSSHGSGKAADTPKVPRVLHSEAVAKDPKTGKLTTRDVQSGTVTSSSGTALTVKSSDGTQWTWTLSKDTRFATEKSDDASASDVKTGDSVVVRGTRAGDVRTARMVSDPPGAFAKDVRQKLKDQLDPEERRELRKMLRGHGRGVVGGSRQGAQSSGA
ncbi:hypothetical protein [Streptomyces sp. TS71-3]|uniref:hypothetical protein n=1 Tax=Streptomyces sp. TS71-3 TaxID=2733862 RepID=UPI001B0948BC|nr:hypothetical protein [Streptomyces sp. TS71-3]GHJ35330.1 hypothetical protein Sm713_09390 [Streptomyces sp. TS71-3]